MSNEIAATNGRSNATVRGDVTRDRLFDALESIAADEGLGALSHRSIARRAQLHSGLIHYHFGTVERLLEEAIARRAQRLSGAQLAALSALFARGHWSVADVVSALWQPFSALGGAAEGGWRNYLCMVARFNGIDREALVARHFDDVSCKARDALAAALPEADDETLRTGLRYVRTLFEQEAVSRCRKRMSAERRARDDRNLVRFAAAGLRGLAGVAAATSPYAMFRSAAAD
jgi:AcrR family transcriptional regulator